MTRRAAAAAAAAGAVAGAVIAHLWDPDRGRARRARLRDHCAAAGRHGARQVGRAGVRRVRYAQGRLRGLHHQVRAGRHGTPDDATLAQKVRSEVLGKSQFHGTGVHVDAHAGVVHLRGELSSQALINELICAVEAVNGVQRVDSYLHLPGDVAPNKQEALLAKTDRT